jgi:hypothetical protein
MTEIFGDQPVVALDGKTVKDMNEVESDHGR